MSSPTKNNSSTNDNNNSEKQSSVEEHVNLRDNNEVFFKIKKKTPLKKLMSAYCEKQGRSLSNCRFIYDGERIDGNQTPLELEMEDNDTIEVAVEQIGGGFA